MPGLPLHLPEQVRGLMRDWAELRSACEGGESPESLSRRCGIPYTTLLNRAVKEDWRLPEAAGPDGGARPEDFSRVAGKLLRLIEEGLDGDRGLAFKEIKTLTGALKELQSLGEGRSAESGSGALTVRFLGDAEEMSE